MKGMKGIIKAWGTVSAMLLFMAVCVGFTTVKDVYAQIDTLEKYGVTAEGFSGSFSDDGKKLTAAITGLTSEQKIKKVQIRFSSDGKTKLYTAKKKADGSYRSTLTLSKLKSKTGRYTLRAYVTTKKIRKKLLSKIVVANEPEVTDPSYTGDGWRYEQVDGKVYKFYYKDGVKLTDLTEVMNIKSQKMLLEVNRTTNTVTVYAKDGSYGYIIPVKAITVSIGKKKSYTKAGTFTIDRKHRWKALLGPSWGQYASHFVNGIYFHSVAGPQKQIYSVQPKEYNKLGSNASHGCVRMNVWDCKWIYDHCALKSTVKVFDDDFEGPFGKPATIKIADSINYDPADPAVPDSRKIKDYNAKKITGYITADGVKVGF